jgi:SAM-dependent methyltransferase
VQIDFEVEKKRYPLAAHVCEHLLKSRPIYGRMLKSLIRSQGDAFWENGDARCREILYLCGGDLNTLLDSVSAWVRFSMEYVKRQQAFLEKRRYASTDYETIRHELYENGSEMKDFYLLALMFSYIFSPNYIGFLSFFQKEMLPRVKGAKRVCDVGCGPGLYLAQMLAAEPGAAGTGLDISPASLEMTGRLLGYYNLSPERFQLLKGDLRVRLPIGDKSQDAVVCCDVIEHLDDPFNALGELRRIIKPGGTLCLSTAIRMESIDHIHLFSHPGEVQQMLRGNGFEIIVEDYFPLTTASIADPSERSLLIDDEDTALGYIAFCRHQ